MQMGLITHHALLLVACEGRPYISIWSSVY